MFAVDAETLTVRLLEAETRGRSEYGLQVLADLVTALDLGDIDPRARVLKPLDLPAFAILDGSTGIGQVGASRAMELAREKAATAGIALVICRNSQPCDDVRTIAELASRANCIGYCTTSSGKASLTATGGQNWLSAHPAAWSFPAGETVWTTGHTLSQELLQSLESGSLALTQGLLSLALTAGISSSRLPAAKKKISPYGAGAEHCCLAVHLSVIQADAHWNETFSACLSQADSTLQRVSIADLPETLEIGEELRTTLLDVARQARVALPDSLKS